MLNSMTNVNETFVEACEYLLSHYNIEETGNDQEIWEVARESETVPHFGNIYQDLIGRAVVDKINEQCPEAEANYFVNARDTYLYAFGEIVADGWLLLETIKELAEREE